MAEIRRKQPRASTEHARSIAPRAVEGARARAGGLPTTAALRALLVATTVATAGAALGCELDRPDTWPRDARRHGRETLRWLGVVEEPTPVVGAIPVVHPAPPVSPPPSGPPASSGSPAPVDSPVDAERGAS